MCMINFYIKLFLLKLSKNSCVMLKQPVHPLWTISPLTTYPSFRKDHCTS